MEKKTYEVEANDVIEKGKKRISKKAPVKKDLDVTMEEILEVKSEQSVSVKHTDSFSPVTSQDIIYDKELYVFTHEKTYIPIRVSEVLNTNDAMKAFIANNGESYGLNNCFVKTKIITVEAL